MTKFKNDKERISFLEDYRNTANGWYVWKQDDELQRTWWRFDLPDCALIVEEQLRTFEWPKRHVDWSVLHWYIIRDWHTLFADSVASRTQALAELKRCEKEAAS